MKLVEQHLIKPNHPLWKTCDDLTFKSKNLYNAGLYQIRQSIFAREKAKQDGVNEKDLPKVLSWAKVSKNFRRDEQVDLRALPAKVAGDILRKLGNNINSFYRLCEAYHDKTNTSVANKPNIPKYLHKTKGRFVVEFNQQTVAKKRGPKGEIILCPKDLNLSIPSKVNNPKSVRILEVRNGVYLIEVVYEKKEKPLVTSGRHAAIDLGIDNLATITFSTGLDPLILKGKEIKAINQGYNKLIAHYQSKLPKKTYTSRHIDRLWVNRKAKLKAHLHKASHFLTQLFDEMAIETVFVGYNKGWKQDLALGKKTNQTFTQIPYLTLIEQLTYKCRLRGITVELQEESYTSKASFLDRDELPVYEKGKSYSDIFSGKRLKRGLYQSKDGVLINADVNGSYNILRKGLKGELDGHFPLQPRVVKGLMALKTQVLVKAYT